MRDYLKKLNKAQYEAATTIDGPMLVLAGAGTGKTHTMITRVAYMLDNGVKPEEILLLTFTNKAAEEMISRAISYCGRSAERVTASTYHSFFNRMLRRYGKAIGISNDFDILTPSQAIQTIVFSKAKDEDDGNYSYSKRGFPKNATVAEIFSMMVNCDMDLESVLKLSKYARYYDFKLELERLLEVYTEYKRSKNLFDYDDLMVFFYKLLNESESVRDLLEKTYKYIIVDEYQDTNNIQFRILKKMRQTNFNIAVVGDDAQSIYSFRGANVENIINFPNEFPNCKIVELTENYRSSTEIIDLANNSYESYRLGGYPKHMSGQFSNGFKPLVLRPENDAISDDEVHSRILDLLEKGVSAADICVIARTSYNLFGIEQLLNSSNLPYEKRGGKKFMELEEVLDIIAYLRYATNKSDELSLFRILQLHPGIGETYAKRICSLVGEVADPIIDNKYKRYKFKNELILLSETFKEASLIPKEEHLKKVKFFIDFYLALSKRVIEDMDTDEGNRTAMLESLENKCKNLGAMFDIFTKFSSIEEFLDAIILDQQRVEDDSVKKIVLTTIHSVKGLEFDSVFVLNCVDGRFPRGERWDADQQEDQEELRCFYVAITRAKRLLHIVAPLHGSSYGGGYVPMTLTRFLDSSSDFYDYL